jgi:mannosyltransferase
VTPTYNLRYVSFSAPALALLAVAGVFRLRRSWAKVAAVGVVVALTIPTDVGQREPFATDKGSDLSETAAIIGAEAHPGNAVVFDRTTLPSQRPRLGLHLYPSDYAGLKDVALKEPYKDRDYLWDTTFPLDEVSERLNGINTVWLLELTGSKDNVQHTDVGTLEALGYRLQSKQLVNRTIIYKFLEGA